MLPQTHAGTASAERPIPESQSVVRSSLERFDRKGHASGVIAGLHPNRRLTIPIDFANAETDLREATRVVPKAVVQRTRSGEVEGRLPSEAQEGSRGHESGTTIAVALGN